jgi:hypothetical protein
MILYYILAMRENHYLGFSMFTSRPTSLLASNRFSLFLYSICVFIQHINIDLRDGML